MDRFSLPSMLLSTYKMITRRVMALCNNAVTAVQRHKWVLQSEDKLNFSPLLDNWKFYIT